jgi:hypothetical protein
MATIQEVNQSIMFGDFTNEQLNSILSAIKYRRSELTRQAKRSFTTGSRVKFTNSRTGKIVIGTVQKVNRKFVIVREPASSFYSTQWRVPASMLEEA